MHGAGEWRIFMGSWEFPTCQDLIAQLRTTFPWSGLTLQKPGLPPSAPLVPRLRLYDPDLTLRTN